MKIKNPFDDKLEAQGNRIPDSIAVAAIEMNDTLDIAWASARSVFGTKAKPEHAVMLLPLLLQRADAERSRRQSELDARREAGSGQ